MAERTNRREFIGTSVAAAAGISAGLNVLSSTGALAAGKKRNITKSLKFGMIGEGNSIEEKLAIAKKAGFDSVEPDTIYERKTVDEFRKGAEKVGIGIDAIICNKHWSHPLSDPDPEVVKVTMDSMRTSMENAKALGGDMVLLVPAVVKSDVMYADCWTRSVKQIKELAKFAEDMDIMIGIENVWNKFLLSPLEAREYIEEINSPFVRFWLDVGNMILFGFAQDWIRTLDELIARVDVKDFKRDGFKFVNLGEGSVEWPEVMKAFDEIGYEGVFAAEVGGGNLDHLTNIVAKPMDHFINEL